MYKRDPQNEITAVFTAKHILFQLNVMQIYLDQG